MDDREPLTDDELDEMLAHAMDEVAECVAASPAWKAREAALLRRAAGLYGYN